MTTPSCSRTTEQLTAWLTEGGELPPGVIEHVTQCSECGETLRRAQLLGSLLEGTVDEQPAADAPVPFSQAVTDEVIAGVRRRRLLRAGLGVAIVAVSIASWWMTTAMHVRHFYVIWSALMILFEGPLVLVGMMAGIDAGGPRGLFKRMRGRQLSGICQGLSEATLVPPWLWRAAFVGLIFLKGAGVILYLLLDVALPIHPDDRADLLRFRIARWWKSRRQAAQVTA